MSPCSDSLMTPLVTMVPTSPIECYKSHFSGRICGGTSNWHIYPHTIHVKETKAQHGSWQGLPLPIPDKCGNSMAINYVGPLPKDEGYNYLVTMTNQLNLDICLVPSQSSLTASQLADLSFDHWFCKNRLLINIVSDCNKLFLSQFWKVQHVRTGIRLKMSTVYHLQMDGASKQTNKAIIQAL